MSGLTVAIMDAESVLARELIELMRYDDDRWFSELRLFGNPDETFVRFDDQDLHIQPFSASAFDGVDIALLGGAREVAAGAVSLGVSSPSAETDAPVVEPGLNPQDVDEHRGQLYVPDGPSIALARLARAIGPVESVTSTILQPVSLLGPRAIEELYAQTRALFNHEPLPDSVIGGRLAFNVLPGREVSGAASLIGAPLHTTALLVPVFGGTVLTTDCTLAAPLSVEETRQRLDHTPGVEVVEDPAPADVMGMAEVRVSIAASGESLVRTVAVVDEVRCVAQALCDVAREIVAQDAF